MTTIHDIEKYFHDKLTFLRLLQRESDRFEPHHAIVTQMTTIHEIEKYFNDKLTFLRLLQRESDRFVSSMTHDGQSVSMNPIYFSVETPSHNLRWDIFFNRGSINDKRMDDFHGVIVPDIARRLKYDFECTIGHHTTPISVERMIDLWGDECMYHITVEAQRLWDVIISVGKNSSINTNTLFANTAAIPLTFEEAFPQVHKIKQLEPDLYKVLSWKMDTVSPPKREDGAVPMFGQDELHALAQTLSPYRKSLWDEMESKREMKYNISLMLEKMGNTDIHTPESRKRKLDSDQVELKEYIFKWQRTFEMTHLTKPNKNVLPVDI